MKHRRTLAATLSVAAIVLAGCYDSGGAPQGENPFSHEAANEQGVEARSVETPSPQAESTPEAPTPTPTPTPTKDPVPTEIPTKFPKHNPELRELRLDWIRFDLLPGWTAEVRTKNGQNNIRLIHKTSQTRVYFLDDPDVSLPGAEMGPANAGKCGAYVQIYGEDWFEPGWSEGPHSTMFPAKGVGYTCGIRGVPLDPESRKVSRRWEMPITSLALRDGQHMGQFVMTPIQGNAKQLKIAGAQAAIMLHQAASHWYGQRAW